MSERRQSKRDAISRAWFFLKRARNCRYSDEPTWWEPFEAYMEASIIFGRTAIQRLKKSADRKARGKPSVKAEVKVWWASLADDPAIQFFRGERDFIVHEGPPVVNQNIGMGGPVSQRAESHYYYENSDIPATDTIERHLIAVEKIVTDAEERFGTSSLSGMWWKDLE